MLGNREHSHHVMVENCAKGGVFLQLCGWMGVHELWFGGVSDTEYLNKSGIL